MIVPVVLAALAGCAWYEDPRQAEGRVLSMKGVRPGSGVIDSVAVLRNARRDEASASAGGTRRPDPHAYRLFLRMDVTGYQAVDVDNGTFMAGEYVEITEDGRIARVSGTTLNLRR